MRGVPVILVVLAAAACSRFPAVRALTPVTAWQSGFATYVEISCAYCACMLSCCTCALGRNFSPRELPLSCRFYGGPLARPVCCDLMFAVHCLLRPARESCNAANCIVLHHGPDKLTCLVVHGLQAASQMVHCSRISCSAAVANPCTCTLLACCATAPCHNAGCSCVSRWTLQSVPDFGVSARSAGLSPYSPSFGTSVGSCGFGFLARTQYPFWAVAALSTSNHYFINEPQQACGECFEVPRDSVDVPHYDVSATECPLSAPGAHWSPDRLCTVLCGALHACRIRRPSHTCHIVM
jgi:hypothetical protein